MNPNYIVFNYLSVNRHYFMRPIILQLFDTKTQMSYYSMLNNLHFIDLGKGMIIEKIYLDVYNNQAFI